MDKLSYVLVGVFLGWILNVLKEWWLHNRINKKDTEYLAIRLVSILDRYVSGCAAVVGDNGLYHGQRDKDGYCSIQIEEPSLEFDSLNVEWKCLPSNLLREILNFPNEIEVAKSRIEGKFDHASPPDYEEFFEERQLSYSILGIEAAILATKLREHATLPPRKLGDWNPVEYMEKEKKKIEIYRAESEIRHAQLMKQIGIISENLSGDV